MGLSEAHLIPITRWHRHLKGYSREGEILGISPRHAHVATKASGFAKASRFSLVMRTRRGEIPGIFPSCEYPFMHALATSTQRRDVPRTLQNRVCRWGYHFN
ncbi:hypothetical protein IscW_ISCW006823 [Ixodes scapularis]|uniref:Uncharacterized protein n=1 Tax=Ixodes scapularis TaxID=6945 RepID=B7PL20_IXOSC|nr:hypothetical protein IscW_ISCW006823 [Ixodes scapularis]|eukprot:XP_002434468.1 hypothetical protein IscW_ISCW006823 [Ixodes scapularis]